MACFDFGFRWLHLSDQLICGRDPVYFTFTIAISSLTMQFQFGRCAHFDKPHLLTIGNFDGVHLGHQKVIEQAKFASTEKRLSLTVLIFEPQPREYFAQIAAEPSPSRLMSLKSKARVLNELGIDCLWCLKFTEIQTMFADEFVQQLVVKKSVKCLVVGDDFRFGRDRLGDFSYLQRMSMVHGFDLEQSKTHQQKGQRISSSRIRNALLKNDFLLAEELLGRPYSLQGRVCYGQGLAHTLGIPTANIRLRYTPPIHGVYGCVVALQNGQVRNGVANIGTRPTVSGQGIWLEVHLHDYSGRLYGQILTVIPKFFVRLERKFANLEQLALQIRDDNRQVRKLLNS